MLAIRTLFIFGAVAGLQTLFANAAFPHVRRAEAACNAEEKVGAWAPQWDEKLNRCVFFDCLEGYVMVDNWSVPFSDEKRAQITNDKSTMELIRCTKATKDDCGATHYKCTDPDPAHLSYCARDSGTKSLENPNAGALICVQCGSGLADQSAPQNTRMCA